MAATVDIGVASTLWTRHRSRIESLPGGVRDLVLLIRDDVPSVANAFAEGLPGARIHVLGARRRLQEDETAALRPSVRYVFARSLQDRLDYLLRIERPQVMIEAGNKKRAHKLSSFQQLFHFVAPGGCYVIEETDACGDPRYDDGAGDNVATLVSQITAARVLGVAAEADVKVSVRELAAAASEIDVDATTIVIGRSGEFRYAKLRDWEANDVLTARYGSRWGSVATVRPAHSFTSNAEVFSHGDGPIVGGRHVFDVPERYLRCYRKVTCSARQIIRFGEYVLPDSWRHPHQRVLNNRQLVHSSPYFGGYLERTAPIEMSRLKGSFYYLDTELPGHFGHITTDVLSRVWGWEEARARDPEVRPLISIARSGDTVPGFQKMIFAALGIPLDDAYVIKPREAVEVETLYGPTPQFENPCYVDPEIRDVWQRLADGLPPGRPSQAERIFISRRPSDKRHCHQTPQVEEFFADQGFDIVFPEDHSYPDQRAMFVRADVIAGFGGSGMFNMMFAPQARVLLVSGDSYNAQNEHLIAAVNGNDLHYFWGRSELAMPAERYSYAAFRSHFDFDLERFKPELLQAIG